MTIAKLSKVENPSKNELIKIAKENGFDLLKYEENVESF